MRTKSSIDPKSIVSFGLGIGTIGVITLLPTFNLPGLVNLSLIGTAAIIVGTGIWVSKNR